jgi:hypothetical protein
VRRLDETIARVQGQRSHLETARQQRTAWLADHPEAVRRRRMLDQELNPLPELPEIRAVGRHHAATVRRDVGIRPPAHNHGVEIDIGP